MAPSYEETYCWKCVHYDQDSGCPILDAHALYNYRDCNDPASILHMLIPRKERVGNDQCRMFIRKAADGDLFEETK